MESKHLSVAQLLEFADARTDDKKGRALNKEHLGSCAICREKLISLQSLKFGLNDATDNTKELVLTNECIPTELMGDFLGNRLPSHEKQVYSNHVAGCDTCFERAASFSWSSSKMTEGVLAMSGIGGKYKQTAYDLVKGTSPATKQTSSFLDRIAGWIASPAPAYAFAVVLLLFMVVGPWGTQTSLTDLGSDNLFAFYEKPTHSGPSFGFADAGRKIGEVPASLSVKNSGEEFLFTWADLENARGYNIKLFKITTGGLVEVYEGSTTEATAMVPAYMISDSLAYRWKVTGETDNGKIFTAEGQFMLAK